MSGEIKYPRQFMLDESVKVHNYIQKYCDVIKIAGSLRRKCEMCGDIELVVVPKFRKETPLFGEPVLLSELEGCDLSKLGTILKSGEKYKQIALKTDRGTVNCEIFVVTPPAQFGVIYVIRTGGANFSHQVVTQKSKGGLLPDDMQVKDGLLWKFNKTKEEYEPLITATEEVFFMQTKIKYVVPENRT